MVNSYREFLNKDNNQIRKGKDANANGKENDKGTDDDPYYSVWNSFPSYKDIDNTDTYKKVISIVIIEFTFFASLLLTTVDFILSISATVIIGLSFLLVFRKSFFSLRHLLEIGEFNPFQNLVFW